LIREIPDHPAFSGAEFGIFEDFRQPRFHALWDLPVYADYDFVGNEITAGRTMIDSLVGTEATITSNATAPS